MNPWIAKAVILAASIVMVAIRAPHGQRSRGVKVVKNRKGRQEVILLTLAWLGFFVPLVWVASSAFSFAEYPLRLNPLIAGVVCLVVGLWLFYRSHADLGTNWSVTLQVREHHQLITHGVYQCIRHPMYSALFLYSLGQVRRTCNPIRKDKHLAKRVEKERRVHRVADALIDAIRDELVIFTDLKGD